MALNDKNTKEPLSMEWQHLIQLIEKMQFGNLTIEVMHGKPVMVKNLQQNIKLTNPDDFKTTLL